MKQPYLSYCSVPDQQRIRTGRMSRLLSQLDIPICRGVVSMVVVSECALLLRPLHSASCVPLWHLLFAPP